MKSNDSRALQGPDRRRSTDTQLIADGGQPPIYAVVELPANEQGTPCPMYTGAEPSLCGQPSTHVFVYDTRTDGDGKRENVRCCTDCAPSVTIDSNDGDHVRADGGTTWTDLTEFRRDLLLALAECEQAHEDVHGLAIKNRLESPDFYDEELHHARLYQNLDRLVEDGLVEKGEIDDRTNSYALTTAGEELVREHARHAIDILRELNGDTDWNRARAGGEC